MRRFANDSAACWYSSAFAVSPLRRRLVGEQQRLTRVARDLVEVVLRAVEPHLGLLLVRDDVGGLLGEAPVLLLRLLDRLLELHLGIGALLEASRELGWSCTSTSGAGL